MRISLEKLRRRKNKIKYNLLYSSSVKKLSKAYLGTIEKDASGFYGFHKKEKYRAEKICKFFSKLPFKSVLDIGAGDMSSSFEFLKNKKIIDIVELQSSFYTKKEKFNYFNKIYLGNFINIKFKKKYDAIYLSHVLEHQPNIKIFLDKVFRTLKEKGFLCIIVPPRKPFIIGGHLNLFNPGLLIYRLILSGFDCKRIKLIQYDYNIAIILKKKSIRLPTDLKTDIGDIDKLSKFFPNKIQEGFNGDFLSAGLTKKQMKLFTKFNGF